MDKINTEVSRHREGDILVTKIKHHYSATVNGNTMEANVAVVKAVDIIAILVKRYEYQDYFFKYVERCSDLDEDKLEHRYNDVCVYALFDMDPYEDEISDVDDTIIDNQYITTLLRLVVGFYDRV